MPKLNKNSLANLWIALAVVGRLIPHPANITPMTSIALFSGAKLSRPMAFAVSFLALILSDLLLAWKDGHAVFGMWTFFTYSGFAMMVFVGSFLANKDSAGRTILVLLGSSLGFWLWTNFGTWLGQGLYPLTFDGLVACYVAAIPFLRNAMLGDLAWGLVLFLSFSAAQKRVLQAA